MIMIWKYTLIPNRAIIEMPMGAKILTVQVQRNVPRIWAMVNPEETQREKRIFQVYGTGHKMKSVPGIYIGTFQIDEGRFIYHVFEEV
jgi:hypothetical protein